MAGQSQIRVKNLVQLMEKKISRKKEIQTEHELRIQEKYIHLVTTMTHVDEMTVEMHRDQKLTDQEKDSIDQFQSIPIRAKEELLNVVMKKPKDVYDAFLSALNNTNQQHIVQMLVSEAVAIPTEAQHPSLISRWYKWLVDNLKTDTDLIIALYRSEALTRREREQLDCQKNRTLRNELLLAIISRKSSDEFQLFKDVLRKSNQTEVAKKFDEETGKGSGSIDDDGHPTSPTVEHRHGVRTTPAVKPSPLSPKPQLPPRPMVTSPSPATHPLSRQTDQKLRSPTEVMSPKSPRSTSKLERQISQPTSPAVAEISLKVASIRQNITDIKEEIVKKKTNESAQLKTDRSEEIKSKESRKGVTTAQAVAQGQKKEREVATVSIPTVKDAKEHNLQQQRVLTTGIKENESLRRELEAANRRLESLEAATEKLKREHDAQIKEFEKQLNNVSAKCEEELRLSQSNLEKETKLRNEIEGELKTANNKLAHLQQELAKEKSAIETQLTEAYKHIDDNNGNSIKIEKEHLYSQDVNETLQELNNERRVRMDTEKLKNKADRQLVELTVRLKEKELELEEYKEKNKVILQDLNIENRKRIEKEQHLTETTQKLSELDKHVKVKKQELNYLQEEIQNVLQDLSDEKRLRIENEQHLAETKDELLELRKEIEAKEHELKSSREENNTVVQELNREKVSRSTEQHSTEPIDDLLECGKQDELKEQELRNMKEKVNAISQDLSHEKRLRTEKEQHLKETTDRLSELGDEVEAKEHELKKLREENKTILQDLSKEKHLRMEKEQDVTEPKYELQELGKQMEVKEEELKMLKDKIVIILQDLSSEKRIRMEQEQHLTETNDSLLELGKKLETKDRELNNLKEENKTILQDLNNEKHSRLELQQQMTLPRDEYFELGKQLEIKEQELENLKEENKAILQALSNEKALRMEKEQRFSLEEERYLTETKNMWLELGKQMEAKEQELKYYQEERNGLLQDLSNEKRRAKDTENRLSETTEKLLELGKHMEAMGHDADNRKEEMTDLLQNFTNEKRRSIELNQLLSETRQRLLEVGKQMEATEHTLKTNEEEKRAILEELRNERRIRMEKEKLLNEANHRFSDLSEQIKAPKEDVETREEEKYDERHVFVINKPNYKFMEGPKQGNEREQTADNRGMFMQELLKKQHKKIDQERRVDDANERSESSGESIVKTNGNENPQRRNYAESEPETLKNNKDQLKKSLEQLFARAVKDPAENQPQGDDTADDQSQMQMNSTTALFPENLTRRVQLAPNLHMVRDRPNPHKNHLIRSPAGALARVPEPLNSSDEDD